MGKAQIFVSDEFDDFAQKERITDQALCKAIEEIERGLIPMPTLAVMCLSKELRDRDQANRVATARSFFSNRNPEPCL